MGRFFLFYPQAALSISDTEKVGSAAPKSNRPAHDHVHVADRGACGDLEFARSLI
jgi:hypothetical protein